MSKFDDLPAVSESFICGGVAKQFNLKREAPDMLDEAEQTEWLRGYDAGAYTGL